LNSHIENKEIKLKTRTERLIKVLFDFTAREDERDDAAMDLGSSEDEKALDALIDIGSNFDENETILDSCGESIAKILVKKNFFNKEILNKLAPAAKAAAFAFLKEERPEWLK